MLIKMYSARKQIISFLLAVAPAIFTAACAEGDPEPSFVLQAMGLPPDWSIGSLRLTLGRGNDEADLERVMEVLPPLVERLRAAA